MKRRKVKKKREYVEKGYMRSWMEKKLLEKSEKREENLEWFHVGSGRRTWVSYRVVITDGQN